MTECQCCDVNSRSRNTTFIFPDTGNKWRVCHSCYRWLTKKFNSKKVWKTD